MSWRDSFVAVEAMRRRSSSLASSSLQDQHAHGSEGGAGAEEEEEEDFLLQVERRARQLRRNTQQHFVPYQAEHFLSFQQALANVKQQTQDEDQRNLENYQRQQEENSLDTFFRAEQYREDSTAEVFTDNPLWRASTDDNDDDNAPHPPSSTSASARFTVVKSGLRAILQKTNSFTFANGHTAASLDDNSFQDDAPQPRTALKKSSTASTTSHSFNDKQYSLRDNENDRGDQRFKARMSGLGQSLKKTLSFKLHHANSNTSSKKSLI